MDSSILAWRIPWTAQPGGLQSTGSQSLAPASGLKAKFKVKLPVPSSIHQSNSDSFKKIFFLSKPTAASTWVKIMLT